MGILTAWLGRDSGCETRTGSFRPSGDQRAGKRMLTDSRRHSGILYHSTTTGFR